MAHASSGLTGSGAATETSGIDDTGSAATSVNGSDTVLDDAGTGASTTDGACHEFFDETGGLGEITIEVTHTGDVPLWVAIQESGCYDTVLLITGPDGQPVDIEPPSCGTCESYSPGGEGACNGAICEQYHLMLVEPGKRGLGAVWAGDAYESRVLPSGCPDAGDSCEQKVVAGPGPYEVSVWFSEAATCGDGPCMCDGQSNPCRIEDPTAMLVDPQVVSTTFDFPTQTQVHLELALK